jgi:hypothetical protein
VGFNSRWTLHNVNQALADYCEHAPYFARECPVLAAFRRPGITVVQECGSLA